MVLVLELKTRFCSFVFVGSEGEYIFWRMVKLEKKPFCEELLGFIFDIKGDFIVVVREWAYPEWPPKSATSTFV